jgi:hypothetical protein
MRIDKVALKDVNPLKVLTERTLFPDEDERGGGQEKEEEKNSPENKKITEIWNGMTHEKEHVEDGILQALFKETPDIKMLATLLNRSDVQVMIAEVLAKEKKAQSEAERREGFIVRKNLEKLNGKIDRANSVWFRRIPLMFRVGSQIEKINIPKI